MKFKDFVLDPHFAKDKAAVQALKNHLKMKTTKPKSPTVDITEDRKAPSEDSLKRLSKKALELIQVEGEATTLELQLTEKKQRIEAIATVELPAIMTEVGVKEFALTNGASVKIKAILSLGIPTPSAIDKASGDDKTALELRRAQAFAFLRKNGAEALIKNFLEVDDLGKGPEAEALGKKAVAALAKLKIKACVELGVHPQTLAAWARERIEAGKDVDEEIFKLYTGEKAFITLPKNKPGAGDKNLF